MFTPHPCATRFCRRCYGDCDTSTPVVLVRQARKLRYGVPALQIRKFDDGTALVRFAAGNFRIVPMELLKPATEAESEEYYSSAEA
jgi:hypothetical protein